MTARRARPGRRRAPRPSLERLPADEPEPAAGRRRRAPTGGSASGPAADRRLGGPDRGARARRQAGDPRGRRDAGHGRRRRPGAVGRRARPGRRDGGRATADIERSELRIEPGASRRVLAGPARRARRRGARRPEPLPRRRGAGRARQGADHPRAWDRRAARRGPLARRRPPAREIACGPASGARAATARRSSSSSAAPRVLSVRSRAC